MHLANNYSAGSAGDEALLRFLFVLSYCESLENCGTLDKFCLLELIKSHWAEDTNPASVNVLN